MSVFFVPIRTETNLSEMVGNDSRMRHGPRRTRFRIRWLCSCTGSATLKVIMESPLWLPTCQPKWQNIDYNTIHIRNHDPIVRLPRDTVRSVPSPFPYSLRFPKYLHHCRLDLEMQTHPQSISFVHRRPFLPYTSCKVHLPFRTRFRTSTLRVLHTTSTRNWVLFKTTSQPTVVDRPFSPRLSWSLDTPFTTRRKYLFLRLYLSKTYSSPHRIINSHTHVFGQMDQG